MGQDPPAAIHGRETPGPGSMQRLRAIDSHTGGEPTRVIIDGGPPLQGSLAERVRDLRLHHDALRTALCCEPRGSGVVVGALLTAPVDPGAAAGVIFFDNAGYLGMCGHGTIGVVTTLAWLGRIAAGRHRIETPVGTVTTELHPDGRVSVRNVPSYRHAQGVEVLVPGHGRLRGDVAWGGNWFFLTAEHGQVLEPARADALVQYAKRVRTALATAGITGAGGAAIDHVELLGPGSRAGLDARNFVLCPGGAYDRSPCGTGTSAKLACLVADGELQPGEPWRQESIIGSVFEASAELESGAVVPTITGQAWITAEATLVLDPADPYCAGIRTAS